MSPEALARLRRAIDRVLFVGSVDRLIEQEGAVAEFKAGAYTFRLAGVTGTSTMSRASALESWLRIARKKAAASSQVKGGGNGF